jgi:hypothetical protein
MAEFDEDESMELDPAGILQEGTVEPKSDKEAFWDEFFDSMILTVPFTFLYLLLDM